MSLRDDLLPVADELRAIPSDLGLRRFAVTVRRRIYDGPEVGQGAVTVKDTAVLPPPRVRVLQATDRQMIDILVTGSQATTEFYKIGPITPKHASGPFSGYSPQELRARRQAETMNVDPVVILVGDDGQARECVQVFLSDDRALSYSMIVQRTERRPVMITGLSLAPSPASLNQGAGGPLQMSAVGAFEDASSTDITPLVAWWVDDARVAAVDSLGVVTATAAGSTVVRARFRGLTASASLQVVL